MSRQLSVLGRDELAELLERVDSGEASRVDLKALTKHFLGVVQQRYPGHSVEVRVPPFAAIQCIEGARHTRGTPPAVVETDPETWIKLARGQVAWGEASLSASGERSDLSWLLPLVE